MVETTLGLRAKLPKTIFLATILLAIGCVPPAADADAEAVAVREPVSEMKCLQLLSSAAEYYKNKDWGSARCSKNEYSRTTKTSARYNCENYNFRWES